MYSYVYIYVQIKKNIYIYIYHFLWKEKRSCAHRSQLVVVSSAPTGHSSHPNEQQTSHQTISKILWGFEDRSPHLWKLSMVPGRSPETKDWQERFPPTRNSTRPLSKHCFPKRQLFRIYLYFLIFKNTSFQLSVRVCPG